MNNFINVKTASQKLIASSLVSLALLHSPATISEGLLDGDTIAKNVNGRDEGVSVSRKLTMTMTDKRGKTRVRETQAFRKYYEGEKKTAIFYLSPKNVSGTAFLTYDYQQAESDDDQWLYLPAMRKVRRISASDRGDYFLGTDFTYEEIKLETRISMPDYTRTTIGKETIDGVECFLVESLPASEKIAKELGISKRHDCIDNNIWMVRKSDQWDLKGRHLKTIDFKDIKLVDDIWTSHTITVKNHKTGHFTEFSFSDVNYKDEVKDDTFTTNSLRRGI